MREFFVGLIVCGDFQSPEEISKLIGVEATLFHGKGEKKSATREWEDSVWSFEVSPSPGVRGWESLEEGLGSLMEALGHAKQPIQRVADQYDVMFRCGQFAGGAQADVTLSPNLLRDLAGWGVHVVLETYFSSEEG